MNAGGVEGARLSGEYAAKAMAMAGSPEGYAILNQGGLGAFDSWVAKGRKPISAPDNGLNPAEVSRMSRFNTDYTTLAQTVMSGGLGDNQVPWMASGRHPQTTGQNRIGESGNVGG